MVRPQAEGWAGAYRLRIKVSSNVDDFIKKEVREQFCEIRQCIRVENRLMLMILSRKTLENNSARSGSGKKVGKMS